MTESERTARAALSRLFEPQDAAGLALVRIAGAEDALRIATGQLTAGAELDQELFRLLDENGSAVAGRAWGPPGNAGRRGSRTWHRPGTSRRCSGSADA